MKKMKWLVTVFAVLVAHVAPSHAQTSTICNPSLTTPVNCGDLPAPIYLSGSTALRPYYAVVGQELINATTPGTIVFLTAGQGSCTGVQAQTASPPTQITSGTSALWIDSNGAECACNVATPVGVTVGVMDVFADTCSVTPAQMTASSLKDFHGPTNAMTFVVPPNGTAKAISAEQAYLAFGFGAKYDVAPWIDPAYFWIRPTVSGTLRMLAKSVLLDFAKWLGYSANSAAGVGCPVATATGCVANGSGDVFKAIVAGDASATTRDKFIGILGLDYLLSQTAGAVKVLAFRGYKQRYAYYPDSTPTALDKRNVRDGHYLPQGPSHFVTAVDTSGTPTNATAAALVSRITAAQTVDTAQADTDLTSLIKKGHLVPECAMKVSRADDGGDFSLFQPAAACDCFFELTVGASATPGCASATPALGECTSTACGTGTCRRGVCEVR